MDAAVAAAANEFQIAGMLTWPPARCSRSTAYSVGSQLATQQQQQQQRLDADELDRSRLA